MQLTEPEAIKRAKKKCYERFSELKLSKKQSEFLEKCSSTTALESSFDKALILPECKNSYIVLVNGRLATELSDFSALSGGCQILSLQAAYRTYSTLLVNSLQKSAKESGSAMHLLNAAMAADGVCILVAANFVGNVPLQIISIVDAPIYSKIYIFAKSSSQLTLVQTKENILPYNQSVELVCEENARITVEELYEKESGFFEHVQTTLKKNSAFSTTFVTNASGTNREIQVALSGENAEADSNGVWLLDSSSDIQTAVTMEHKEPHCRSMQLFKGVLQDSATSDFNGTIQVRQKAQKTESYQLNKNLLLSEGAKARCTPNLEIFADDVKASHGATIGKLDPDHLFYLKSRGISERDSKSFLVRGFCEEVLAKLTVCSLQERGYQVILKPLKSQ